MALVENKKAHLNYEILEEYEAGLELLGPEVKSLRNKLGKLDGSHITVRGGEAYLIGASIPPYQSGNTPADYEPMRNRKLLLTKKEIAILGAHESQKGLTIVPLSVYNKGRRIKLEIGLAKGKKKYDKRESLKKKDLRRELRQIIKN